MTSDAVGAVELDLGRASARLFMTQPGLSEAILRLEQELDVQLLTRTRRSVELTAAGEELLKHARRLLAEHDQAVAGVPGVGRGAAACCGSAGRFSRRRLPLPP